MPEWVSALTFLEWADRGFREGDDYGFSNAIGYAKKSVACRIDGILRAYHLVALSRKSYPHKIDALNELGLKIPQVVSELVIEPRNELEHQYQKPSQQAARRAIEIADLFLQATDAESERASVVAVSWNIIGGYTSRNGNYEVNFRNFSDHSMLFIDVFETPFTAKVVNPVRDEILSAPLTSFSPSEAIQLAKIIRASQHKATGVSESRTDPLVFREMKRLGGF